MSSEDLTLEEQACNYQTYRHIEMVRSALHVGIVELLRRAELHDQSKLEKPEVAEFTRMTPKLAGLTYGSPEYQASLKELGPALDHHYAKNRHHPEHFKRGIKDMNLIDLFEMFCDWRASAARQNNGNLRKSIETGGARYDFPPALIEIFENTIELFE